MDCYCDLMINYDLNLKITYHLKAIVHGTQLDNVDEGLLPATSWGQACLNNSNSRNPVTACSRDAEVTHRNAQVQPILVMKRAGKLIRKLLVSAFEESKSECHGRTW